MGRFYAIIKPMIRIAADAAIEQAARVLLMRVSFSKEQRVSVSWSSPLRVADPQASGDQNDHRAGQSQQQRTTNDDLVESPE
jgi:hypothetical protein